MKASLKNTLAALLLAAVATTTMAAEKNKSDELGEKIANELIQEITADSKAGKNITEKDLAQKFLGKMRAHLGEFKEAVTDDCVKDYGKEKNSQCQCVTDKLDFEQYFAMMEKQVATPDANLEKEARTVKENEEAAYKACGLDINISREAEAKAAAEAAKTAEAQPAKK